jgi:phospholipid/cholesterol/gamma-HCH transport system substrate-binding protein
MRATNAVEISTGLFVLLGFASLFFLVTQITSRELAINGGGSYQVEAQFENVGSLKPGAAVSMAGVTIGRVDSISFDQQNYKAVVRMRIASAYDRIPKDSDASIMTSGLLGGQYVGLTAGGSEEYLKQGDRIEFVQDAFVLEKLINQLFASFSNRGSDRSSEGSATPPQQPSHEGQETKP